MNIIGAFCQIFESKFYTTPRWTSYQPTELCQIIFYRHVVHVKKH